MYKIKKIKERDRYREPSRRAEAAAETEMMRRATNLRRCLGLSQTHAQLWNNINSSSSSCCCCCCIRNEWWNIGTKFQPHNVPFFSLSALPFCRTPTGLFPLVASRLFRQTHAHTQLTHSTHTQDTWHSLPDLEQSPRLASARRTGGVHHHQKFDLRGRNQTDHALLHTLQRRKPSSNTSRTLHRPMQINARALAAGKTAILLRNHLKTKPNETTMNILILRLPWKMINLNSSPCSLPTIALDLPVSAC